MFYYKYFKSRKGYWVGNYFELVEMLSWCPPKAKKWRSRSSFCLVTISGHGSKYTIFFSAIFFSIFPRGKQKSTPANLLGTTSTATPCSEKNRNKPDAYFCIAWVFFTAESFSPWSRKSDANVFTLKVGHTITQYLLPTIPFHHRQTCDSFWGWKKRNSWSFPPLTLGLWGFSRNINIHDLPICWTNLGWEKGEFFNDQFLFNINRVLKCTGSTYQYKARDVKRKSPFLCMSSAVSSITLHL